MPPRTGGCPLTVPSSPVRLAAPHPAFPSASRTPDSLVDSPLLHPPFLTTSYSSHVSPCSHVSLPPSPPCLPLLLLSLPFLLPFFRLPLVLAAYSCLPYPLDLPDERKFDCISAVEMAEHVGIANFQLFLQNIAKMLDDDGLFYMQVKWRASSAPSSIVHSTTHSIRTPNSKHLPSTSYIPPLHPHPTLQRTLHPHPTFQLTLHTTCHHKLLIYHTFHHTLYPHPTFHLTLHPHPPHTFPTPPPTPSLSPPSPSVPPYSPFEPTRSLHSGGGPPQGLQLAGYAVGPLHVSLHLPRRRRIDPPLLVREVVVMRGEPSPESLISKPQL